MKNSEKKPLVLTKAEVISVSGGNPAWLDAFGLGLAKGSGKVVEVGGELYAPPIVINVPKVV